MILKIAVLSKATHRGGGASTFAENLADWLGRAGHDVTHFCAHTQGTFREFQRLLYPSRLRAKFCRKTHWATRKLGFAEAVPTEYFAGLARELEPYDVLHFQDLFFSIAPQTLELLARKKPVFFTAHDCSAYTGGCLYPLGCEKFHRSCGGCPQVVVPETESKMGMFDFTAFNFQRNARLRRNQRVHHIFPSLWLRDFARSSAGAFTSPVHHVPYGFDPRPFAYVSRAEARQRLGLIADAPIVCISSANLHFERKGVRHAIDAIRANIDKDPVVLLVGGKDSAIENALAGVRHWFTGYLENPARLGLLYAAADLFLFSTLEDNLPLSVQEAMGAGTPVVGYATGGVPEMVTDGSTGWLVPTRDQAGLNRVLGEALSDRTECARRGERAREDVSTRFSVEGCVQAHENIYAAALRTSYAAEEELQTQAA